MPSRSWKRSAAPNPTTYRAQLAMFSVLATRFGSDVERSCRSGPYRFVPSPPLLSRAMSPRQGRGKKDADEGWAVCLATRSLITVLCKTDDAGTGATRRRGVSTDVIRRSLTAPSVNSGYFRCTIQGEGMLLKIATG
ncbi:hypothetical protein MYCTH_2306243 [Thermothelomyces thermophilus ATCC 42464]|uniref:Uncharacterized protein n=1 Tax=Thermothelomyces thermophilus (strain ATCC 42464 / BCRC 31852 / DSM 1799) TaxID=573729 RepID=G2QH69_THET4|nr:uncharacterized protein MYCTH_2306243 [Thermothelomyces thermophilus ATCC 42464]AEO58729.1 hypothetical protein MYCTH_2306243 [Thermothelomyces thermophilus ATCC 42464]